MENFKQFKPAEYEPELFSSGETKLIIAKEFKKYIDDVLRYIYRLEVDDVKKIMEVLFTYSKNLDKLQKEYEKLYEETEDDKWVDYLDQLKYAVEYIEDSYQRLQEYKNWKIDNETPINTPKVVEEKPKVVEEKPKVVEDNRPVVKYQDQEKIDIKTLLKVGAIFDYEKYYRDKKERTIFYITKLTDKTVYYKECNEIKIRNSGSEYGGFHNYKVILGKDGKNEEHKMLIRKLSPDDFFDDDGKVYDFNFQVPRQFDYGR